jgi:hypothetical protein
MDSFSSKSELILERLPSISKVVTFSALVSELSVFSSEIAFKILFISFAG